MAITEKKPIHPEYKNMKTKMKRQRQNELPRFTVGALALAGASAASGATVQITLTGNKISTTGGNQLVADLTGDGVNDIIINDTLIASSEVAVRINRFTGGGWAQASFDGDYFQVDAKFEANGANVGFGPADTYGTSPESVVYLNPVTFTDSRINGGAATNGYLQVNAFNTSVTNHTVELTRLVFDDASTTRPVLTSVPGTLAEFGSAVPEPSSLGLLALGAGGLLLRRSRAKAA